MTLPQDKANHLAYGLFLYSLISLWSPIHALGVVLIIATLKEIIDSLGYGTCDIKDWIATTICPILIEILRRIL